jgi:hypothetical protein
MEADNRGHTAQIEGRTMSRIVGWRAKWLLALVAALCSVLPALAAPPAGKQPSKEKAKAEADASFLRVLRDADGRPTAMQTAIVRYVKPGQSEQTFYVDLVGAVHIGDRSYYDELNKQFEQYDALLYELVAPEERNVPKPDSHSNHPIGMLQEGMTDVLDLDFQLHRVDYGKKNFVHADMSPAEFDKSMADRKESFLTMMFRMMGYSIAKQSAHPERSPEADLISALFSGNRALALKRIFAEQFEDLEGSMAAIDGPEGSTIITERNKVALDVLKQQIAAGKHHLGIFYGAGHLPDMQKRLETDFKLKRSSVRWVNAWDLTSKPPAKAKPKP